MARGRRKRHWQSSFLCRPSDRARWPCRGGFCFAGLDRAIARRSRAVQVGDPFKEKLLLEACLELLRHDAVAGIQDMGAAGLTCSTCETASRAGTGIEIDLAKVPQRESGMTPYEIMLSESQERMLIIAKTRQGRRGPRNIREMGCAMGRDRPRHRRRHDASCAITARLPRRFPPGHWRTKRRFIRGKRKPVVASSR